MTPRVRLTRLLLAGACLSLLGTAHAQDAGADDAAESTAAVTGTSDGREEVTVTATRRATKIQSTPIAITAVGEKAIENAGVRDTQSLTQVVPALSFPQSENSASVTARVRGVGTQGSNPGLESAVGIFIDGVVRSRNSVAFGDLGDIQRVEVLRGPQGTLFGRNTSAGLISVITKPPSLTEVQASASASYESFDGHYLTFGLSAPLIENELGVRVFGSLRKRDGYMDINPGVPGERDGNNKDSWALRGQVLAAAGESTTLRIIVDAAHKDEECCYAATIRGAGPGGPLVGGIPVGPTGPQMINNILTYTGKASTNTVHDQIGYADHDYSQLIDEWGLSAELNSDLGWANFTSVTAYRDWEYTYGQDADFSGLDIIYLDRDGTNFQRFKTFTQEFRFAGETAWVDWLVGGFYSHEVLTRANSVKVGHGYEPFFIPWRTGASVAALRGGYSAFTGGLFLPTDSLAQPGSGNLDFYKQTSESFALFTHNVFHVTDKFDVTLGLRWTTETKDLTADYNGYKTNPSRPTPCEALEAVYGYNSAANPAVSGNATLAAFNRLACLPGGRGALVALTAGNAVHFQTRDETEFSGIVTLSYEVSDDINVYGTYSRGYKAGGFNLDRSYTVSATDNTSIVSGPVGSQTIVGPDTSFPAEMVDAYEIGAKFTLAGGNLNLNVAAYYQDFENFQLNTFSGISFFVTSVPEVISKGVELDASWFTDIDGLSFNFGVAYADARYGDGADMAAFAASQPALFYLPGNHLTSAPEWTLTAGFTYEFPVFGGSWMGLIHADTRYVSSQLTGSNLDPNKLQDGYALVNLRLGLATEDERFAIEFWARNLFDERYFQISFDAPLQGDAPTSLAPNPGTFSQIDAFLGEPLTMGITLKTRF